MKYKIGFCGGSFDPLHVGHVDMILQGASMCDRFYVALSYSRTRDHIPMEYRYRWLRNTFRHLPNVTILLLEDTAGDKESYSEADWERGRDEVLSKIGAPVDVVLAGEDYVESGRFEALYHCPVIYIPRNGISSTLIRQNPLAHWNWIAPAARPYFVKRVLIVGSESTGKSTLAKNLSIVYEAGLLEEVGRDVCDEAGCEDTMVPEDFTTIMIRHKDEELKALRTSRRLLFEDTDVLTTLWYSGYLLASEDEKKKLKDLAEAIFAVNRFDLVLFLEPTVPFVQDGTRNESIAAEREACSQSLKQVFLSHGVNLHCLSGDYTSRFLEARKWINETFAITEVEK